MRSLTFPSSLLCCILVLNRCSAFTIRHSGSPTSTFNPPASLFGSSNAPFPSYPSHDTLRDMLWLTTCYFSSMVDVSTNRFYLLSRPQTAEFEHVHCPLRELGSAWDATTALLYWKDKDPQEWLAANQPHAYHKYKEQQRILEQAVQETVRVYSASFTTLSDGGVSLDSDILLEPPTVAHSALLLLVASGTIRLSISAESPVAENVLANQDLEALTRGILAMQRPDGAFRIQFSTHDDNDVYQGIEFYPGEAMVALMEVYNLSESVPSSLRLGAAGILKESTKQEILEAMERAFPFYRDYYHEGNTNANYNVWQVQAFARFLTCNRSSSSSIDQRPHSAVALLPLVEDYIMDLCLGIVHSRSWKELARGRSFYPNLETVEIACGLDAIAQGICVAQQSGRNNTEAMILLSRNAANAVEYLKTIQDQVPREVAGSGGLGFGGLLALEQRLDVTGHAIGALTKLAVLPSSS